MIPELRIVDTLYNATEALIAGLKQPLNLKRKNIFILNLAI
jgi:hypothetical protein